MIPWAGLGRCSLTTGLLLGVVLTPSEIVQGTSHPEEVVIRGRVVCQDSSGRTVDCTSPDAGFAIQSEDGPVIHFLADDPEAKMFQDPAVRERRLEIHGWRKGPDQIQIVKIFSIKHDQLYDIYFYCRLCHIKAFAPGPCWCCQKDFELVEVPAEVTNEESK